MENKPEEKSGVIEVEVEQMSYDEQAPATQPSRVLDDHHKSIYFFGKASSLLLGIASPGFFLSLISGLVFSILYSEANGNMPRFILMIVSWCLVGVFVLAFFLGLLVRHFMRRLKMKDPNFEKKVHADGIYE